jgi:hypothetical protein
MKRILILVAFACLLVVPVASAAKPVHAASVTQSLTGPLDSVTLQPVSPSFGGSVVFQTSGVTVDDNAIVYVDCFQGSAEVMFEGQGYFLDANATSFVYQLGPTDATLATSAWVGGAASCSASLRVVGHNKAYSTVATVGFDVAG